MLVMALVVIVRLLLIRMNCLLANGLTHNERLVASHLRIELSIYHRLPVKKSRSRAVIAAVIVTAVATAAFTIMAVRN